jgi:tetratricopeptide (TPR) repeat protein
LDIKQKHLILAKSKLAEINSTISNINPISRESVLFYRDLLDAEILLEEGDFEGAVAISKKAKPLKIPDVVLMNMARYNLPVITDVFARAYQANNELDKAIDEYKRLVAIGRGSRSRRLVYPKYYYCLAKLFERQADYDEAKKYYEKFISLWKDADPGIAEVEDAKKRLAGLKE